MGASPGAGSAFGAGAGASGPGRAGGSAARASAAQVSAASACPCGSGATYGRCCRRLHAREAHATTATDLMRSRYSAYAVGDTDYLLRTWHPATRPAALHLDPARQLTGLRVLDAEAGGADDETGVVRYRVSSRAHGREGGYVERGRFARRGRRWVYVDGDIEE